MFTPKFFEFLAENRFKNDRTWFSEHKEEYKKYVLDPLTELAQGLTPAITAIDPQIVTEPKVDKTISRIYRDMRRAADGMLYRDEMWLSFKRNKHEYEGYPEFYFVMTQKEFFYGCGYYMMTPVARASLHGLILAGNPKFKAAREACDGQDVFAPDSEKRKKSKYPDADEGLRDWLDRTSICYTSINRDIKQLYDPNLPQKLGAEITKLKPLYDLLVFAESIK
jgi:Uncharacterized conserved protein